MIRGAEKPLAMVVRLRLAVVVVVPDLMHFDWGGSRGRLRPEVQFARLQPLAENERRAPVQVAQTPRGSGARTSYKLLQATSSST